MAYHGGGPTATTIGRGAWQTKWDLFSKPPAGILMSRIAGPRTPALVDRDRHLASEGVSEGGGDVDRSRWPALWSMDGRSGATGEY